VTPLLEGGAVSQPVGRYTTKGTQESVGLESTTWCWMECTTRDS